MHLFLLFCALAMLAAFLGGRLPASGWQWDLLNGIGFAAVGAVAYLGWDSRSLASQASQRFHSNVAVAVAVLVAVHAVGFLLIDKVTVEYIKLKAPPYMLAGLVGALVLSFLAATSFLPLRRRLFPQYLQFRNWHTALSIAALLLSLWHVLGAGYYLSTWYGAAVFILIVAGAPLLGYRARRRGPL